MYRSLFAIISIVVIALSGCTAQTHFNDYGNTPLHLVNSGPTTLPSSVFNFDALKVETTKSGERRSVCQEATATLDQLEVHITTLQPGEQSHPPHRHPHEEMMLLKEGTLEAFVNGQHIPMPTGSVLFIAPNDLHNVRNVGTTPATYFVVTWRTPLTGPEGKPTTKP